MTISTIQWDCQSRLSHHSMVRQQQRGKRLSAVSLLVAYHDLVLPTKRGCRAIQISRHLADELKADGYSPQDIDAAMRTTAIIADNENIVTLYRAPSIKDLAKHSMRRVIRFAHLG